MRSAEVRWQLPTVPLRVSSAVQCFTTLFGMGRGSTTASSHHHISAHFIFYNFETERRSGEATLCRSARLKGTNLYLKRGKDG